MFLELQGEEGPVIPGSVRQALALLAEPAGRI